MIENSNFQPNPSQFPVSHNRTLIVALSIVVAGLFAIVIYALTTKPVIAPSIKIPNQNATSTAQTNEWKIYANEQYGYEVGYPVSWEIWHQTETGANIADPKDADHQAMSVAVYAFDMENSIRDTNQVYRTENISVAGSPAKKFIGESGVTGLNSITVIIAKDNKYYILEAPSDLFDKIISTFKFTN